MFKLVDKDSIIPNSCYEICQVWEDDGVVGKIICNNTQIGRVKNNGDITPEQLDKLLELNEQKCPFCNKILSNKSSTKRHILNSCPVRKVEELELKATQRENDYKSEIVLPDNMYIKCASPNTKLRDIIYISGSQGSGKSYYCRQYIDRFMEMFPDKPIILLSRIDEDKAFKDLIDDDKMIPLDINDPDIIENPIDAKEELGDSLSVFDDFLQYDKELAKSIRYTLSDVMLNGRCQAGLGLDTYCLVTSHMLTDYNKTRDILNESSSIVCFPHSGQIFHIKRVMREYIGMSNRQIKKCLAIKSRWLTLHKRSPNYVLSEAGIFAI